MLKTCYVPATFRLRTLAVRRSLEDGLVLTASWTSKSLQLFKVISSVRNLFYVAFFILYQGIPALAIGKAVLAFGLMISLFV